MSKVAVFFDFDGTLTKRDTLLPFLRYTKGRCYYFDLLLALPWLVSFALKLIPNNIAKERLLRVSLKGLRRSDLSLIGESFSHSLIGNKLNRLMLDKLIEHQKAGHVTVLVSASLDVYLECWAKQFGFDYCLCTSLDETKDGYISGYFAGKNCYGDEKVKRINALMDSLASVSKTYAYGDTAGDMPMLKWADNGYFYRNGRLVRV